MSVYRTANSVRALPRLAAAFAATLAASCASVPDGGGEGSLERLWEASTSHAARAALRSPAPAEGDLKADDADARWDVDRVLARIAEANPTLGAAEARLEAARAAHDAALAQWWPQLSLGLEYAATDNPSMAFAQLLNQQAVTLGPGFDATPGWIENWRKELRVDWPLFAPGRAQNAAAAESGERAAELASTALERRLLNAGIQALIGLRAARDLAEVTRESVAVIERRLAETERRVELGAALAVDAARIEVRLAAARQEAARAELTVVRAESALNALLGRPPQAPLPLDPSPFDVGAGLPESVDGLLEAAGRERLDLRAAAFELDAISHRRGSAEAARLPALRLFAAYDVDGADPAIDTDLDSGIVGVGLRWSLSAATAPAAREGRAHERAAESELRERVLAVASEVRNAYRELEVAQTTLGLAASAERAADEAYRVIAEAQDAGAATVTDVLEAEDARRDARVRSVAARSGVQLARARLVAATGGIR